MKVKEAALTSAPWGQARPAPLDVCWIDAQAQRWRDIPFRKNDCLPGTAIFPAQVSARLAGDIVQAGAGHAPEARARYAEGCFGEASERDSIG
jgi:hypothetical protein